MKFTTPHLTFDKLREAQQDYLRSPTAWQIVYEIRTATLARIQRDRAGRIVLCILEGPYDPAMAEARTAELLAEPLPQALTVPAGAARH